MRNIFYIMIPVMAIGLSSCAMQRYVRSDVVRSFVPSVSAEEVTVYGDMDDVPSGVLLIGEVEARSPRHNTREYVESLIRNETAENGGNGVFVIYNETSLWTTPLNTGHGVMMLVADTVTSNGDKGIGRQFVEFLNRRNEAEILPSNIVFLSAGRDMWWHKLAMPDGNSISPKGYDFIAGYDRRLGYGNFYFGALASLHRTRFDYKEERCGIDVLDIIPRTTLRYRNGKRFVWAADIGIGYSSCRQQLTDGHRVKKNGLAYLAGLECGYIFTRHAALTIGYNLFGGIYDNGAQKIQRFNMRVGLNLMF